MLDTRGPLGLNKMFPKDCENCGTPHFLDWKVLSQMLMSPVEGYFLRKLGELPELKVADENGCGNMLYAFMMDLGGDILEHSMEFADRTSYLDKNVQVFMVEGVEVIMVPAELRGDRPTMALDEWRMEKTSERQDCCHTGHQGSRLELLPHQRHQACGPQWFEGA